MTTAAWKIVKAVTEPAVVTSLAITALTSGVALWSAAATRRQVAGIASEVAALRNDISTESPRNESHCRRAAANWFANSRHLLRELVNPEEEQDGVG